MIVPEGKLYYIYITRVLGYGGNKSATSPTNPIKIDFFSNPGV